jgi:hypothetical protein
LITANLAEPSINVIKDIIEPEKREQVKQVVQKLGEHPNGKLPYYIFGSSYYTYSYYLERYQLQPSAISVGPGVEEKSRARIKDQMAGLTNDTWLIFGHGKQHVGFDYESLYLDAANQRATLIDTIKEDGAAAYLYRFPPDKADS